MIRALRSEQTLQKVILICICIINVYHQHKYGNHQREGYMRYLPYHIICPKIKLFGDWLPLLISPN